MQLNYVNYEIYGFDLYLDPVTLVLKHDLDIVKMNVCAINEAHTFNGLQVIVWTDRYIDRQINSTKIITYADGNDNCSKLSLGWWKKN